MSTTQATTTVLASTVQPVVHVPSQTVHLSTISTSDPVYPSELTVFRSSTKNLSRMLVQYCSNVTFISVGTTTSTTTTTTTGAQLIPVTPGRVKMTTKDGVIETTYGK